MRTVVVVVAVGAVGGVGLVACGQDDPTLGAPPLPPILTTSTTPTTIPVATTLPAYYEVQRGDTLTVIAASYGLPVQAFVDLNGLRSPDDIEAGQQLRVPSRDIVATQLPPTVPGQTAPPMPGGAPSSTAAS